MTFQLRLHVVTLSVFVLVSPRPSLAQTVVGVLGIPAEIASIERSLHDSRDVTP